MLEELYMDKPHALILDGPHRGKITPVTGPWEIHTEDDEKGKQEYVVVPRGNDTWKFPIHYRLSQYA